MTRLIRLITLLFPMAKPIRNPAKPAVFERDLRMIRLGVLSRSTSCKTLSPKKASYNSSTTTKVLGDVFANLIICWAGIVVPVGLFGLQISKSFGLYSNNAVENGSIELARFFLIYLDTTALLKGKHLFLEVTFL